MLTKIKDQTILNTTSEDMSEIPDCSVDFIMTSPPYWNLKDYGSKDEIGQEGYEEYLKRLDKVWEECYRVAKNGSVLVININTRRYQKKFYPIPFDIATRMKEWSFWDHVIWYIPNALPQPNHYMERLLDNKFESCLVFIKGGADEYNCNKPRVPQKYATDSREGKNNPKGRCLGNILRIPAYRPPNIKEMGYHVAAYPEELAAFFIQTYSNEGDTILDPFLGSGTTLKVAQTMKRKGYGFELNSKYIPLIEKRILEKWALPDWKDIDLISNSIVNKKPRKSQYKDD